MPVDIVGKIAYIVNMQSTVTHLAQRLALEARYDGPIPQRRNDAAEAFAVTVRPVVSALAKRRRRVAAAVALCDPSLARMSRYLSETVMSARARRSAET
jgi:hypothetical protein